jgi:hypothetical protein
METLRSLFTTADASLAVSPEDLAPVLLQLARARVQGAGFWPDSIVITGEPDTGYPYHKKARVEAHVNEAWQCLQRLVALRTILTCRSRTTLSDISAPSHGQLIASSLSDQLANRLCC